MPKTKREFSAGGVVFKKVKDDFKIVLIAKSNSTIWCLPKGKIEAKETREETARREIKEETGLEGKPLEKIGSIKYWFFLKEDRVKVFKTVFFFLFEYLKGSLNSCDHEVDHLRWFSIDKALQIMTYPSERAIVKKAKQILRS